MSISACDADDDYGKLSRRKLDEALSGHTRRRR